ncbi:unnamed protein product [Cochlearia groenlandica]
MSMKTNPNLKNNTENFVNPEKPDLGKNSGARQGKKNPLSQEQYKIPFSLSISQAIIELRLHEHSFINYV